MDIGIGLPATIPGVDREHLLEWARRAEQRGFSSLSVIDRIVYANLEPLVALTAAAAVTERIRVTSTILIAPYRANAALLAKQAASLDAISDGRLRLGIAVGGREDDYELSEVDFHERGAVMDRQLEELTSLWNRAAKEDDFGPRPANGERPALLIGGQADAAFRRAAKYADGWTLGGGTPDAFKQGAAKLREAWQAEGRDGEPRTMALFYFSLGENAEEDARNSLGSYYAWLGEYADQIVQSAAKDDDTLKGYLAAFEEAGVDEVIGFPSSADPRQVELFAAAALSTARTS
jgi:alkanesulfonate monooxygenase SsuD/methylene tetrahydromethanopterin reductase-like flavin-dependent oxidoreductase (luciferase family)